MAEWDGDRRHRRPRTGPHRGTHGAGRTGGGPGPGRRLVGGATPPGGVHLGRDRGDQRRRVGGDPGRPRAGGLRRVEHSAVRDASARAGPVVTVAVDGTGRIAVEAVAEAIARSRADHGRAPGPGPLPVGQPRGGHRPAGGRGGRSTAGPLGMPVHVDAATAAGHVPIDLDRLGADLVSVSAHKLGGPAGIGALIIRRGLRLRAVLVGGEQERARRAGLENVVAAIGFGRRPPSSGQPGPAGPGDRGRSPVDGRTWSGRPARWTG